MNFSIMLITSVANEIKLRLSASRSLRAPICLILSEAMNCATTTKKLCFNETAFADDAAVQVEKQVPAAEEPSNSPQLLESGL